MVSPISIRRDIARLAARGALIRTHGGASARPGPAPGPLEDDGQDVGAGIETVDAIVLPPVDGRAADTLRLMAKRRGIPFLAESSPQAGGIYLGPDNFAAGRDLGTAGRAAPGRDASPRRRSSSSRSRTCPTPGPAATDSWPASTAAFAGSVEYWRVERPGQLPRLAPGQPRSSARRSPASMSRSGSTITAILAALEAAERLGCRRRRLFGRRRRQPAVRGPGAGGERLKACAALFPEIVGMRGVDVAGRCASRAPACRTRSAPRMSC